MTYGISLWLPFHGAGTVATRNAPYYGSGKTLVEPYAFWSNVSPSLGCGFDMREPLDYAALRRLVHQWRQISANYYGDFWPLTAWTRDTTVWIGWQFDRPEAGQGVVQVFRRQDSPYESARLKLRAIEPDARYAVVNLDQPDARREVTGRELLENGLPVAISEQPGAVVITYEKLGGKP
jgi:alpha-galactosidase